MKAINVSFEDAEMEAIEKADIIILNPGLITQSEIKDKAGAIKEKSEEEVDLAICHSNGTTSFKHQFKNPKETGNGDTLTLSTKGK